MIRYLLISILAIGFSSGGESAPEKIALIGPTKEVIKVYQILSLLGVPADKNVVPSPTQKVLFIVSFADGPMPEFRENLKKIEGYPHGREAIFLTDMESVVSGGINNQEPLDLHNLFELVTADTRRELIEHKQFDAYTMPIFSDADAALKSRIEGL